jgi:hypothetical protein
MRLLIFDKNKKSPSISRKGLFYMELAMGLEPATG